MGEVLGEFAVADAGGTSEPVPREAERLADLALGRVLLVTIGPDVLARGRTTST